MGIAAGDTAQFPLSFCLNGGLRVIGHIEGSMFSVGGR